MCNLQYWSLLTDLKLEYYILKPSLTLLHIPSETSLILTGISHNLPPLKHPSSPTHNRLIFRREAKMFEKGDHEMLTTRSLMEGFSQIKDAIADKYKELSEPVKRWQKWSRTFMDALTPQSSAKDEREGSNQSLATTEKKYTQHLQEMNEIYESCSRLRKYLKIKWLRRSRDVSRRFQKLIKGPRYCCRSWRKISRLIRSSCWTQSSIKGSCLMSWLRSARKMPVSS